ncbi:MAG: hypothetical protein K2O45_08760 [Oscillospiraceae bacterium]|nr:hypothetical protein [Oscillospiraceae bacterium]
MDDAMIQMIIGYAEKLDARPIEVLTAFFACGTLMAFSLGMLFNVFFDRLVDRLCKGISCLIRWLLARKGSGKGGDA